MTGTVGQLMIDDALPEDMRGRGQVLDKKGISSLLSEVARKHPEQYRDISHNLSNLGRQSAQSSGGFSFGLRHLQKSPAAAAIQQQLQGQLQQVLDDDRLDDTAREQKLIRLAGAAMQPQQDAVYKEAVASGNPLGKQVVSGARGNRLNLSSLLGSDMLYTDQHDDTIPVPIMRSYSEGLQPWETWAATYGARKGVLDTKLSVASSGYLAKQLNQVTHRLVVTDLDHNDPDQDRGLPVAADDSDNEGALLARDTAGFKRNTPLTPTILTQLKNRGHHNILIRSPLIGGSPEGGVYARDVGVREQGTLPGRGEFPGMAAAQSLAEPITQGSLSSKHSGGVSGAAQTVSGFDYIDSQINIPKHVKGGATHSDVDGIVGRIEDAPAGGKHVHVGGVKHYVQSGSEPTVRTGDQVEAGDVISSGIPSPAKVVEHKGIGEGRRYFTQAFRDAMNSAGIRNHRRNIELLGRGLINHVRLTDEYGEHVPGDIVPYSTMEHLYKPRRDAVELKPALARDKYLEKPVLHYSIGTKLKPSTIKELDDFGIQTVTVHHQPPPFEPEMLRGTASIGSDPDWMTRMLGSGIKGNLLKSVHRGASSDENSTSFIPSLARSVDFGRNSESPVHKPEPGQVVQ